MAKNKKVDIAKTFGASEVRTQRFAIYIPNKDKNGKAIAQQRWIEAALRLLSEICGGATAMPPVRGAWLNKETDHLIIEEPVLVYSFIEAEAFEARLQDVVALVHEIGRKTNQGQMAIEFDQALYLIDIV